MRFIYIVLSFLLMNTSGAGQTELDDYDVEHNIDMAAFFIGSDNRVGTYHYIVIRTTNQCLVKADSGLSTIPCEPLKKIPEIKIYLESGKRP